MFIRLPDLYQTSRCPLVLGVAAIAVSGCKSEAQPQVTPAPEVSVVEVRSGPVTVYDEYVAQTQAPDTIEVRARVTGLLERQAVAGGAPGRQAWRLHSL